MMGQYILAHDLGTSGNKSTLYDVEGALCASELYEYPTYYPHRNWVEQDPSDWWKAVCSCTKTLIQDAGIDAKDIVGVSFSAQMMGCLLVDRDANPLYNMITWADTRAVKEAEYMEEVLGNEFVYKTTGHRISASYSGAKLLWIKNNKPEIYEKAYKVLHAKDYVIQKLTGAFVTDYSDACGMNLFDINALTWSEEIVEKLDICRDLLPEVHPSTDIAGTITAEASLACGLVEGTPVVIGGGDGACAAVGAGVVSQGKTYNVLGSSSWISMASKEPVFDTEMRTFNWVHLDKNLYTPCGTMQTAGFSYNWLKNTLCDLELMQAKEQNINPYEIINGLIDQSSAGSNGILFLPYLLGERSPRWNPDAKAAFVGMTMTSEKADIMRSVLEGVGYNLKVILDIFDTADSIDEITMIGGGAKGQVWLQILADIWQKELVVPVYLDEATSMGAAVCAGVGVGAYDDFTVVSKFNPVDKHIKPRVENRGVYEKMYDAFNACYEALVPVFGLVNL